MKTAQNALATREEELTEAVRRHEAELSEKTAEREREFAALREKHDAELEASLTLEDVGGVAVAGKDLVGDSEEFRAHAQALSSSTGTFAVVSTSILRERADAMEKIVATVSAGYAVDSSFYLRSADFDSERPGQRQTMEPPPRSSAFSPFFCDLFAEKADLGGGDRGGGGEGRPNVPAKGLRAIGAVAAFLVLTGRAAVLKGAGCQHAREALAFGDVGDGGGEGERQREGGGGGGVEEEGAAATRFVQKAGLEIRLALARLDRAVSVAESRGVGQPSYHRSFSTVLTCPCCVP